MNENKRLPAPKLAALVELSKNLGIDYDAFKNMVQSKTDVSLIIPELANLKNYDILTIHWKSENPKSTNQSLPIPITENIAGKEFLYQIPSNKSFTIDVGNVDIWYTVQQCGSDEIRHSSITQSSVSHPSVSKLLPQLESMVNSFELKTPDFQKTEAVSLFQTADDEIVYAKIHPAIGTGRVGNSTSDYYIAPEYANQPPPEFGKTRDASGAIKREAAKFRIYGYNKNGVAVSELTAANANITWTVEVANKKASWYYFAEALDVPGAPPVGRRNPLIRGTARKQLEITPSAKSISGVNSGGVKFDDGKFKNTPVYLGELKTDNQGHLLVLGGYGKAASPSGAPLLVYNNGVEENFNNSVDWYDDISDGPVSATVNIKGKMFQSQVPG